jgi:CRP/FNR family transcriptional regulator, dissimilatory nitrate respiration regulator
MIQNITDAYGFLDLSQERRLRKKSGCCVALHPSSLRRTKSTPHSSGLARLACETFYGVVDRPEFNCLVTRLSRKGCEVTVNKGSLPVIPLFQGLSEEQKGQLSGLATHRATLRGQPVFFEGDKALGFFILLSGRVKISKLSPEGKEQILHLIGPGDPFGEVPMFAGGCFPANAVALEDTELLFFSRERFMDLIGHHPALAMNMLTFLAQRLVHLTRLVENLSLKEVHERLAAYLLHISSIQHDADTIRLDINKGQLASLLGTIPETLSRILTRLHNEDLIAVEGRNIVIRNRQGLQKMAENNENGV